MSLGGGVVSEVLFVHVLLLGSGRAGLGWLMSCTSGLHHVSCIAVS